MRGRGGQGEGVRGRGDRVRERGEEHLLSCQD